MPKESVTYVYDHQNRMTRRNSEFVIHDGWQIVLTFDATGKVKNRNLWGANQDELVTVNDQCTLCDHLGSVRDTVDVGGKVFNHMEYSAYGKVTKQMGKSNCVFGYTGKMFDVSTELQWNINRWYDAEVGRWLNEDLIALNANNTNLYCYVQNQITNNVDYQGHMAETVAALGTATMIWQIVGGITTITGIGQIAKYFIPTGGTTVYAQGSPNSGGTPLVWVNTGGPNVHITSAFNEQFGSKCATSVVITSTIKVYDTDVIWSDLIGTFTRSLEYTRSEHENQGRCGKDPIFAHGQKFGIYCYRTIWSQCFSLENQTDEACDPGSGIELSYQYNIIMRIYS